MFYISSVILLLCLLPYGSAAYSSEYCKCTPGCSCWPSKDEWDEFNTTLSGQLIQTVPPASVCYTSQPNYDESKCEIIRSQWSNASFHSADPTSVDYPLWADNPCPPIYPNGTSVNKDVNAGRRGCSIGDYPVYVVNATESTHVAEALKWAGKKNVRLLMKSTGHSHTGRSVGYGSLSIWTHNLRGVDFIEAFQPTACPFNSTQMAARVSAGATIYDTLQFLAKHDAIIVTGADATVGLIGFLTGGGHGYTSTEYGMGADNLLEATIVTPPGEILIANPCQNPDLFFAIRGGGGGTYGVVLSAVVKAYPSPKTTKQSFAIGSNSPNTTKQFYALMGEIHAEMPRLKAGGMAGYYYVVGPPLAPTLSFTWVNAVYDKPNGTVEALIAPILSRLDKQSDLFFYQSNTTAFPSFFDFYKSFNSPDGGTVSGSGIHMGSRLLSSRSLSNASAVATALEKIGASPDLTKPNGPFTNPILIGHLIAPNARPDYYPETVSMNPAWRNSVVHLIIQGGWEDGTPNAGIQAVRDDISRNKTDVLRQLSPETGAYFNEADAFEPDWKNVFFGPHYDRLLAIKKRYDPLGVLWCRACVGSDEWAEDANGRLCKTA